MAALFKKFAVHYGNLWTSQLPTAERTDAAIQEWGEYLAGVTPEQIKMALANLPDMPPSLPAFRRLCVGQPGLTHNTAAYRRFPKALPKPKASEEVVAGELNQMRKILKRGANGA